MSMIETSGTYQLSLQIKVTQKTNHKKNETMIIKNTAHMRMFKTSGTHFLHCKLKLKTLPITKENNIVVKTMSTEHEHD